MKQIHVGELLIAPPSVKGNFWYKTVIMITEHHEHGSMGLVLNKRSQMSLQEFGEQLGFTITEPGYVYLGGPVNSNHLSMLHTNEWSCMNTMQINDHFSLSSAEDILPRLSVGDTPRMWRMFLGTCGWSPGQLIGEIRGTPPWNHNTSWCLTKSEPELVFTLDTNDQWCKALDQSAQEFAQNILL